MSDDLQLHLLAQKLYPYLAPNFFSLKSGYDGTTYTPTYLGGTSPGTTTYSTQTGAYIRIGNAVLFTATLVWTAATGTGDARISLPFAASASQAFTSALRLVNVTFANGSVEAQIDAGVSYFYMRSPLTNAVPTNVAVEAAGNVIGTGLYFID